VCRSRRHSEARYSRVTLPTQLSPSARIEAYNLHVYAAHHWIVIPRSLLFVCLFLAGTAGVGCRGMRDTDMTPLDKAGVLFSRVEELRDLNLTDAEVQQLLLARQSGLSEDACIELLGIVHDRNEQFADGQAIANLRGAGMQQSSVLELERLNQLGLRSGEAQAILLARLSDEVVLAIARRRAAGQPALSGAGATSLQNLGMTERQILGAIQNGTTDDAAKVMVERRNAAAAGSGFVRPRGSRRR
jgi:hypothetical protein